MVVYYFTLFLSLTQVIPGRPAKQGGAAALRGPEPFIHVIHEGIKEIFGKGYTCPESPQDCFLVLELSPQA